MNYNHINVLYYSINYPISFNENRFYINKSMPEALRIFLVKIT